MTDTVFALSSGALPAGIAVVRVSGPQAGAALKALAGSLPAPRLASLRSFRDAAGQLLDEGLALWFPGPASATGEDLAELHLHGGRAVVAAVLAVLDAMDGMRAAQAGEFTRRAFTHGRIDLAQAEGLADLLVAETETQRRAAMLLAEGGLGRKAEGWRAVVLHASALVEAELDLSDEDDVGESGRGFGALLEPVETEVRGLLAHPPAERLKDGVRVVLAGPPNAGKSSLFNVLVGRQAAIVTEIAGTTRDRIEAPVVLEGVPLLLIDTAGLHDMSADPVEAIGIARTGEALAEADLVLWLGEPDAAPPSALLVASKADLASGVKVARPGIAVSATTGEGLAALRIALLARARALLPPPDTLALNARHRAILNELCDALASATTSPDLLIAAEHLRLARSALDALVGRSGVEDMLDALFGTFCVGK